MSDEIKTLDILKGEGKTKEMIQVRKRCDFCGEPAHFKFAFVLPNARNNPASRGYREDDISWCEDASQFTCKECKRSGYKMEDHDWCAMYPANEKFAHLFLEWRNI